jgi:hypothetical protein
MRREHAAAREVLTSKSDDEIRVLSSALSASLDGIDTLLATLPHGPVEPSLLLLELDEGALFSSIRTAGSVHAPRGVLAADVVVRGLSTQVNPYYPLRFHLALSSEYPCRSVAELKAAAVSLAFHARVHVLLETATGLQPLTATLTPLTDSRGVVAVTVAIPRDASKGSKVVIRSVVLFGQCVFDATLPARVRFVAGIQAPLLLPLRDAAKHPGRPSITSQGIVYAPQQECGDVFVFAADGTPLPPIPLAPHDLSKFTNSAAFIDATGTLLLADAKADANKLVAIDVASGVRRWSIDISRNDHYHGFAALPADGVFVTLHLMSLGVYRLSDGVRCSSIKTRLTLSGDIAADPVHGCAYVTSSLSGPTLAFHWNGAELLADGTVEAVGLPGFQRHVTVMPPTAGAGSSGHESQTHLVVGIQTHGGSSLHVFSLPDRHLVHTHTLKGIEVTGLAADPSGTALAVCDATSEAIHVLQWPLPGMPLLM